MTERIDPFTLVFRAVAAEDFPPIQHELEASGLDPDDRDGFVLTAAAGRVLQKMRSPDTPAATLDNMTALLHHGFRFWMHGEQVVAVPREALLRALESDPVERSTVQDVYLQVPERRIWAEVHEGSAHQPMDGCFVSARSSTIDVLAVFGLHAARQAFAVVVAQGPSNPERLTEDAARLDGSGLFSSLLPGGAEAGLVSLATNAELLLLVRRLLAIAPPQRAP